MNSFQNQVVLDLATTNGWLNYIREEQYLMVLGLMAILALLAWFFGKSFWED